MKFTQLAESLREGLKSFYLVEGEETFFRDHAVSAIRAACGLSQPLLNDVRFEGETLKGEGLSAFVDGLYALPFLDERRLVRLYDYYPGEREWEAGLKRFADRPCATTTLVLVNGGKRTGAAALKRKDGVLFVDCSREDEETLARWLYALMKHNGLVPDADAAALMVRYCAQDAARMKKETEKLRALLGEGGRVTAAVVGEQIAKDAEYKIYELTQAASRGNASAFSEILSDLLRKGFDENAVLSALVSHYKTLTEIAFAQGETDDTLAERLKIKRYAVQKDREILRRIGRERAEELYSALYGVLFRLRSGGCTKSAALSEARAKIFLG